MWNLNRLVLSVRETKKPVIAWLEGSCAGGGLSLAMACDFSIAEESCKMVFAFAGIGLAPDMGSSLMALNRLGPARATDLFMTGRRCSCMGPDHPGCPSYGTKGYYYPAGFPAGFRTVQDLRRDQSRCKPDLLSRTLLCHESGGRLCRPAGAKPGPLGSSKCFSGKAQARIYRKIIPVPRVRLKITFRHLCVTVWPE